MPVYEYLCPCGAQFEVSAPMGEYRKRRRCQCGRLASRLPSSGLALVTDTSLTDQMRNIGKIAGRKIETRADFHAMEADGIQVTSKADRELVRSQRGKELDRQWGEIEKDLRAPVKVTTHAKRVRGVRAPRRSRAHQNA